MNFLNIDDLSITNELKYPSDLNTEEIPVFFDTEFTLKQSLKVNSVQLYLPSICKEFALVYQDKDLSVDFNPWYKGLQDLGISVEPLSEDELDDLSCSVEEIFQGCLEDVSGAKESKLAYKQGLESGSWDKILLKYKLNRENLDYKWDSKQQEASIEIKLPKLNFKLIGFFNDVDLFKCVGQNHQNILLNSRLESTRVLRFNGSKNSVLLPYTYINNELYECSLTLGDALNRFPVLSGNGLENQCKVYQAEILKIDVEKCVQSSHLKGLSKNEIMSDFTLFQALEPVLAIQYAGIDPVATYSLSLKHQELLSSIRSDFGLHETPVRDTTGSNVGRFLIDLYEKHFLDLGDFSLIQEYESKTGSIKTKELNGKGIITKLRKAGTLDSLANLELNNFGLQTFRTVGGLLYTRTSKYPYLNGIFSDLDEKSCYSTKLSNINIYLGTPIVSTFKNKKYKPKLRDVVEFLELNCFRDSWFIRVSGKFEKALNTLILSDLRFTTKREKFAKIWDKRANQQSINHFNAYKVASKDAESCLLAKEIKFGLITADLLDVIKLLPESWVEEYLGLLVDAVVFIPKELCCSNLKEYCEKFNQYPSEDCIEKFDPKTGLKTIETIYSRDNLSLQFPAFQYFDKLRTQRAIYKKSKNPIQEIYKLFSNSAYGALACEHLACNNLLTANIITAGARATSWLMINALNGFQVITDGCTFSWQNIPLGYKFKDLILDNPLYLKHLEPSIKSVVNISEETVQNWIDTNFKQHLHDFYQVDSNHIPANLYDFELKDDSYDGLEHKYFIFDKFINHGSGTYIKGRNEGLLLCELQENNLIDAKFTKIKARSFKGSDKNLIEWYVKSLCEEYVEPIIYSEKEIIKFGLGNVLAIRYLNDMPKGSRIAHPMGFSRENFKLMKLITRSQFIFSNETQLRNFERNLTKLNSLCKLVCNKKFWQNLKIEDLEKYGVNELIEGFDYWQYAKTHDLGLGLEFLTLTRNYKGNVEKVRVKIAESIDSNVKDFNARLNLDRQLERAKSFSKLFAAILVKRIESELKLKNQLILSSNEPTIFCVSDDDVVSLQNLLEIED